MGSSTWGKKKFGQNGNKAKGEGSGDIKIA